MLIASALGLIGAGASAEIVPTADGNAARKEERMRTHGWLSIKIKRKGQHALRQI